MAPSQCFGFSNLTLHGYTSDHKDSHYNSQSSSVAKALHFKHTEIISEMSDLSATNVAEIVRRLKEAEAQVEVQRLRADEAEHQEEVQRRQKEKLIQNESHWHAPLNKGDFLRECHEAGFPVRVEHDLLQVTQGLAAYAEDRKRPEIIRWSQDLGQRQLEILGDLPLDHMFAAEGNLTTRQSVRNLEEQAKPIDSEDSLRRRQLLLVYGPLELLINDLKRDPDLTDRFGLHGEMKIREHLNGVQIATNPTNPSNSASKARGKSGPADLHCSFEREPPARATPRNGAIVWICEVKSSTENKLTRQKVVPELPNHQYEIDVDKCVSGDESEGKVLVAEVITQLFASMVKKGKRFGIVDTGECMIFIRIDEHQPSIVEYHMSCPDFNPNDDHGRPFFSAVSQVFAFTVQALAAENPSPEWWTASDKLPKWKSARVGENDIPPSGSPPTEAKDGSHPNRPVGLYRGSIQTRSRSGAGNGPAEEADDEEKASDSVSDKKKTQNLGMHKRPDSRRKMQSDVVSRAYCTHECVRGLAFGGPLDKNCPNVKDHGSKHIDRQEFLRLMREQLDGEKAHDNCKPINASGHIGHLFKINLLSHGYTLVAKAVALGDGAPLLHEEKMYDHLRDLQGRFIPACPGRITLNGILESRTYGWYAFRNFLFLSYAGKPVLKALSKVDNSVVRQVLDALAQLHQRRVMHRDAAPRNMLYDARTGKYMVIDLELSEPIDEGVPEAVDFYIQKGKRKWEDDTESEPFATESKALLASMSSSIRAC
ncbi:hypothetical protein E4U12_004924 [Claviceps purpurea]|nr:hypothetical protein E4U12_004924 [Claviceps purpurea]